MLIVIGVIGVFLVGLYPSIPAVRGAGSSSGVTVTVTATPAVVIEPGGGGGGSGGGGGGGGATDDTRITSFGDAIAEHGLLFDNIEAFSLDNNLRLDIPEGTTAVNRNNIYIPSVRIKTLAEPPEVPDNMEAVGAVYELLPDGAKFDPPITLAIRYDTSEIPEGMSESNLYIAKWIESSQEWIELESTVDPTSQTVATKIDGFSIHTVMARSQPASFSIAELAITPDEVQLGESVNVNVTITNDGDLTGSYEVNLQIDELLVQTKEVTLAGGDSETVSFIITLDNIGEHIVNVGGLFGTYEVRAPKVTATFVTSALTLSPDEVGVGESVSIKINVTNTGELPGTYELILKVDGQVTDTKEVTLAGQESRQVMFVLSRNTAGSHVISIDDLSGMLRVYQQLAPPENVSALPPTTPINPPAEPVEPAEQSATPISISLWIITAIIAAGLIGGIGLMFVIRLRRY